MLNIEKWPNIPWKPSGVHNARFLKYFGPFPNIMHERVKWKINFIIRNVYNLWRIVFPWFVNLRWILWISEMIKSILINLTKFTGRCLCQSLFFIKVGGLRPVTLLKKRLWHWCFPVNYAKFVKTPFL